MHYQIHEGTQRTWYDRFGSASRQFTTHNWLPAVTAVVMIAWIGLLFMAMRQGPPANPGKPSDFTTARAGSSLSVTPASNTSTDSSVNESSASAQAVQSSANTSAIEDSAIPASKAPIAPAATEPLIGGRGGGESSPTPNSTVTSAPPAIDTGAALTVGTPLTSEPITVAGDVANDGVQLNVNPGGLL